MSSLRAGAISALIGYALMLPFFAKAQNAYPSESLPCPNAHLASQYEADAASPKGSIVAGITYVCPNDARLGISNDAGAAKDYLRGIICVPPDRDNYGGVGPDETIRGLDAKFAQCAATFLKAVNATGRPYCIAEGKRSVEKQEEYVRHGVIACKYGAQCEHPRGVAIDIKIQGLPGAPCSEFARAHQTAPQYGLTFYLGCKDAYHFVAQKAGCSSGGTTPIPGSGGTINPNTTLPKSFYDFPQYAPAQTSQFGSPLNTLASSFTQPAAPTQNTYQPITTPTYEPITIPVATTSSFEVPAPYTYNAPTTTKTNVVSVFDKLELITTGATSTPTSVRTETATSSDSQSSETGTSTNVSNVSETYEPRAMAENSVLVKPIVVTETFSGNEPVEAAQPANNITDGAKPMIIALLTTLRDMLVSFVTTLKARPTFGFEGPWLPAQAPVFR